MDGIWIFPLLLAVTLVAVFQPLFSRSGYRPLPHGAEENARTELLQQRERLLHQLKEWQLEGGREEAGGAAVLAEMERELAEVLTRLDRMLSGPAREGKQSPPVVVNRAVDRGFAAAVLVLLAVVAGGLYLGLVKPAAAPANGAAHNPDQAEWRVAVERLAQRMEQEPNNLAGWLKLARSQTMLGNGPEAVRAYNHILLRQKDHVEATVGLAELQVQSGMDEQINQGVATLEALLKRDPDQADALWLLGSVAARAGDLSRAVALWQRLLPLLPVGSEARTTVETSLQEVRGQMPAR